MDGCEGGGQVGRASLTDSTPARSMHHPVQSRTAQVDAAAAQGAQPRPCDDAEGCGGWAGEGGPGDIIYTYS